jgi:Tfp pilus assembly protein PilN
MKEIDFLPEWYKSGRRQQIGYRTQCVALVGMFVVMMAWNLVSIRSVSKATAELAQMAPKQSQAQSVSGEFKKVESELAELQRKARVIEEIASRIDVASVLAEMSFLVDEKIILSKVEFTAEQFDQTSEQKATSASVVRVAGGSFGGKQAPLGKVRFKIVINGIASDPSDVAELICRLEDSPYFCLVRPSFSRYKTVDAGSSSTAGGDTRTAKTSGQMRTDAQPAAAKYQVSEFEISCYLANYRQDGS